MKWFNWLSSKKEDHHDHEYWHTTDDDDKPDPRSDPDLLHARAKLAELERLADERTMAGLEWERDLQVRKP